MTEAVPFKNMGYRYTTITKTSRNLRVKEEIRGELHTNHTTR